MTRLTVSALLLALAAGCATGGTVQASREMLAEARSLKAEALRRPRLTPELLIEIRRFAEGCPEPQRRKFCEPWAWALLRELLQGDPAQAIRDGGQQQGDCAYCVVMFNDCSADCYNEYLADYHACKIHEPYSPEWYACRTQAVTDWLRCGALCRMLLDLCWADADCPVLEK